MQITQIAIGTILGTKNKVIKLADLIPEGLMVGWDSYLDSDMAADKYAYLKDLYDEHKNNPEQLKGVFEIWLKKFVVEPYGTDVDLDGWHAIALISKEPLFKQIVQASKLDVRPYMRIALETLWDEEKQGSETIPGPEGLKKLIQWITPWT